MLKNVTLSAEASLIERARKVARNENRTLNAAFREWLEQYTSRADSALDYKAVMKRLGHVNSGRRFTRDEMHER